MAATDEGITLAGDLVAPLSPEETALLDQLESLAETAKRRGDTEVAGADRLDRRHRRPERALD